MIKETTKKINFYSATLATGKKQEEKAPTVNVSVKFGRITFPTKLMDEIGMEGKFVKMYYEPQRRIIGWRLRDTVSQPEMKEWRLCTKHKATKNFGMPITALLKEFKGGFKKSSYIVPVQKYREMSKTSEHHGQIFYFAEVKDDVTEEFIRDNKEQHEGEPTNTGTNSPESPSGSAGAEGTERTSFSI